MAETPQSPTGRIRRLPLGIARGLNYRIDFEHHKKLYLGLYEVELNRYLKQLCKKGFNCFDVGGAWGYDALVLARLSGGRVISFEASPSHARVMRETFQANPSLSTALEVREVWVSAEDDPHLCRSTLDSVALGPDGFVPDFMKIDIEGAEVEALLGAEKILTTRHPGLLIETHSEALDSQCQSLLEGFGYRPFPVEQRKWLRDYRPVSFNRWLIAPEPGSMP